MPSLKFNTKIYKKEAIQKAISAYSHLARFRVKDDKDYKVVEIDKVDPDLKGIFCDEFANYVLGMSKK